MLALVIAATLAGCSAADIPAEAGDSASLSAEPITASPEPSPSVSGQPQLADLVLSPEGLGPLAIGLPLPVEDPSTAVVVWNGDNCAGDGEWVANYPSAPVFGGTDKPFSFAVSGKDDPLTYVIVWSNSIATAEGVRVGSSLSDLIAAYPTAARTAALTSDLYVVTGVSGNLVFEVATQFDPAESQWTESAVGTVVWAYATQSDTVTSITTWQGGAHCLD